MTRSKLSRSATFGIMIGVTAACFAPEARAQDTARARVRLDSIAEALRLAQARLDALEQQVTEAAQNGVHTRSGTRMELTGRVMLQAFGNNRRVNNVDNPQFVRPDTADVVPVRGGGMSMRQTLLAFQITSPDVAGAQFSGDISTDFYGGQQPSSGGRTFPLLRLRVARATLRWSHAEVMAGQEVPVIAQVNPVSIAASGTPEFAAAGNLWLWLPQVRLTLGGMGAKTAALQFAVVAPTNGDPAAAFDTDLDPAERSQRPFLEGRARFRWEMSERRGEIGCGGHLGWIAVNTGTAPGGGSLVTSNALACDLIAPFGIFELRGEAYHGQALRGLGGGGVGQALGPANIPIRDEGGWAQLNIAPSPSWTVGVGCGADRPILADLPANARQRNESCSGHFTAHLAGPLLVGVEYRRIATTYASGTLANDHFNIGFGFEY